MYRILIIRPGAIGDVIVTLPVIRSIRNHYPDAQIEIMGYPTYLEIVKDRFYANAVSRFDQAEIATLFVRQTQVSDSLKKRFAPKNLIVSFVTGKDQLFIGNLRATGARTIISLEPFPGDGEGTHIVDHLLKVSDLLGIPHSDNIPKIFLKNDDLLFAERFLKDRKRNSKKMLVALHPGSGSRQKNWPIDRFAALIKWLKEKMDAQVLVISGPADSVKIKELEAFIPTGYLCAENLPLPSLAALLQHCNLFIGNDSGITHLSAAMGVKTLAIFGPTDPEIWAPRGKYTKTMYKKVLCSPCLPETRKNCFSKQCLESVEVEDVICEIKTYF